MLTSATLNPLPMLLPATTQAGGTSQQFYSSPYLQVCLLPRTTVWHSPAWLSLLEGDRHWVLCISYGAQYNYTDKEVAHGNA